MRTKCPFCGASEIKVQLKTPNCKIVACLVCTNAWTVPQPGRVKYADENFHQQFSFTRLEDLPSQWKKGALMQVDLLARYLRPQAKILEIGCGVGILLKEFSRRGFDVFGIEPSKTASESARQSGLNVIQGYFPDTIVQGLFDAIIMSHVLEHIQEPIGLLKHVSHLAPGGYVLLVQTNWRGLMPRIYKEKWYAWVPEHHYWHFTPKGFQAILKLFNWRIIKVEYSSLFHHNRIISLFASMIPGFGDQFHLLAKIPT